jgi:hypothetical protein
MDVMDRVIAEMSPEDTAAALRLLNVRQQMDATEADAWRRRIVGWAKYNQVGVETSPSA